jgi:putative hydroxymethylpyrimidine transport system permease protein
VFKSSRRMVRFIPPVISTILFLGVWEAIVRGFQIPRWLLPAPSRICISLIELRATLLPHCIRTLQEALIGLGVAVVLGIIIGVLVHQFQFVRKTVYPFLVVSQTIPIIVLAPLLVIWLGYGFAPKLVVVLLACFFPIAVNTVDGLDRTEPEMLDLLFSMGCSKWRAFRMAKMPQAAPFILSGTRVSATYAVMAAVVGEWMGSDKGLGVFIMRSFNSYLTDRVFVGILLISLFSVLLFLFVDILERTLIPWHYKALENDGA